MVIQKVAMSVSNIVKEKYIKSFVFIFIFRSEQARQLYATRKEQAKSIDCSLMSERKERGPRSTGDELQPQSRSKSSDNVFEQSQAELSLDSNTLKRMLHPLPQGNSVHSSPEQVDYTPVHF